MSKKVDELPDGTTVYSSEADYDYRWPKAEKKADLGTKAAARAEVGVNMGGNINTRYQAALKVLVMICSSLPTYFIRLAR